MTKLGVADLTQLKQAGKKIAEALVFDVTMTRIFERGGVDVLLVGDSYTGYLLGRSADEATVDGMILFASAIIRAAERAVVTVDLPGPVCEAGPEAVLSAARRYRQEAAVEMAKIDIPSGDERLIDEVNAVRQAGLAADVRVRFRPGLAQTDGVRAENERALRLAHAAEDAGASLIEIYEGTPELYRSAAQELRIPVLGGRWSTKDADGKIFVYPNLIGYRPDLVDSTSGPATAHYISGIVTPFLDEVHAGAWETADKSLYAENRTLPD